MNVIQNTFRILNINAKVTTWLENHECTEKLTEIQSLGQNFLDIFLTFDRKSLHTFSHIVNNTYISKCQNAVAYILQNTTEFLGYFPDLRPKIPAHVFTHS